MLQEGYRKEVLQEGGVTGRKCYRKKVLQEGGVTGKGQAGQGLVGLSASSLLFCRVVSGLRAELLRVTRSYPWLVRKADNISRGNSKPSGQGASRTLKDTNEPGDRIGASKGQ